MKQKSKILLALLAVALLVCIATVTLAACNKHEHYYLYDSDDEYHWQVCSDCGETTEKEAHVVTEWKEIKPATHYTDGRAKGVCSVCGRGFSKVLTLPLEPGDEESQKLFEFRYDEDGQDPYYSIYKYIGDESEIAIPSSYRGVKVTSIGEEAFNGCTGLSEITIPDSVESIGSYAFYGCTGLKTVNWNATNCTKAGGYYAIFSGCTKLEVVNIGDKVQAIPEDAFSGCAGLKSFKVAEGNSVYQSKDGVMYKKEDKSIYFVPDAIEGAVTILDGCTCIGNSAFYNCTGLTEITIPDSVTSIGDWAFYGCTGLTEITIPDSVTSIGGAFRGCTGLQTVTIGEGVQSIGYYAFDDCTGLKSFKVAEGNSVYQIKDGILYLKEDKSIDLVPDAIEGAITILDGCTRIGNYAFSGCTGLSEITIPNSVTSIGEYAFRGCTGLQTVTIGDGVTSIDRSAFYNCTGLQTVNWNATNCTEAGSSGYYIFNGCTQLATINIGDEAQAIPACAFYGCTGLTEITIPDSVTSIGYDAFYGCTGLQTATINAQSIGEEAFNGCTGLQTVTIGDGVTSIGNSAFYNCTGLQTVNWNATNCTKAGSQRNYIFEGCTRLATVNFGENVQTIPEYAFSGCTDITKVNVTSLKSWCEIEFGDVSSNPLYMAAGTAKLYLNDELVTEIKDLDGVIEIPNYVFYRLTEITSVTIPDSVTSIGSSAFYGCDSIKELTVPKNVTSVGELAFGGMDNLMSITWDAANCEITTTTSYSTEYGVFYGSAANIASVNRMNGVWVTIGANCENIDDYTFAGLDIDTIFIDSGSSLKSIGEYAFANCHTLRKVPKLTNDVTVADTALYGSTTVMNKLQGLDPSKLHTVGEGLVFYEESKNNFTLVDYNINGIFNVLDLPKQITISRVKYDHYKIGKYAFAYRKDPIVTIPSSVTDIDSTAFYGFSGTKINLDDNMRVEEQDNIVYKFVDDVPSILYVPINISGDVKILNGVTEIPEDAFSSCKDMKSITIPNSVTSIGARAFEDCTGLTSITIPDNVISIGYDAFSYCSGLQTVNWNATNCTTAGSNNYNNPIFKECTHLTTVNIGDNVQSIPAYAFSGCTGLTEIIIPDSVTSIGWYAFSGCTSLQTVYYEGTSGQWDSISISDGNSDLKNATRYYFSAEDPYKKGTAKEGEEYWHWNEDTHTPEVWVKEN